MTQTAASRPVEESGDPTTEPTPPAVHVRPLRGTDVATTARLHREHLPHGLFPQLGDRFVRRWHRTFLDSPFGWAGAVDDEQGRLLAFAVVATDQQRYVSDVLRGDAAPLAAQGALGLLVRPPLLVHFVRTRAHRYLRRLLRALRPADGPAPSSAGTAPDDAPADRVAVVHAIVTDARGRGRGGARLLLAAAEEASRLAGADHVALVTEQGGGAGGFYDHLGWERTGSHLRDGRVVLEFRRRLGPTSSGW